MGEIKLKPCPKCGKPVEARGGFEKWIPTYYDPDSGGGTVLHKMQVRIEFLRRDRRLCRICRSVE